ncbi:ComEA family DNA-binding protein [Marinobacter daepoensis]|uniref:ComEA family DNA-binding protein n=1 Tax=Marinobacter daepoensis TaxID=262077 RepID=A0ABS3BJ75_9GAMM|nr:ComEA family DNA-binding protein [Marinobacter daepoensis]MBN7770946.1 ComEA family DNA-binding protein [Marinobacter daepoensis]MBY6033292.1 ComEA family DNA-binding protein [Marinobacter daepoensis]MBY6078808.1 ComEA family DNA-binding protein [Marinobacter daepoensis]
MKPASFLATLVLFFSLLTGTIAVAAEQPAVNINTADVATLASLSGVGESKAQAIIDYREANGPFASVEALANVKGIGARTVEKNADRIAVK